MALSFSCRVAAVFFCLFSCFAGLSANSTSQSFAVVAKNRITSTQDSVSTCQISPSGEFQNCQEFKAVLPVTGEVIPFNNPIAVAANEKNLFIVNYGTIGSSLGTSFVLKCDLPQMGSPAVYCTSILALFSAAHITGISVTDDKLLFVQSFAYVSNAGNRYLNMNYLVSCNLPAETEENQRLHECGQGVELNIAPGEPQWQENFNTSMEITNSGNTLYVSDYASRVTFKCAVPDANNHLEKYEVTAYQEPPSPLTITLTSLQK